MVDLTKCGVVSWAEILDQATRMGAADALALVRPRTGASLAALFASAHRRGHAKYLRAAYMAGRFHVAARDEELGRGDFLVMLNGRRGPP